MRIIIILFSLFMISASLADDRLAKLKRDANEGIQRELKALESSRTCVQTASSVESFENCNYDSRNFNVQKEEAPDTGTTTERIKSHAPKL